MVTKVVDEEGLARPTAPAEYLDEVPNFRDIGGMQTENGSAVRTGLLFRSGHLSSLSDEARAALDSLGISLVVDLRFQTERGEQPSVWPGRQSVSLLEAKGDAASEGPHVAVLRQEPFNAQKIDDFYVHFYRAVPFDEEFHSLFAETILRMAQSDGSTLVHCSVGKDRTGILIALIEHVLGVPRRTILDDYMKSRDAQAIEAMVPAIKARLENRLQIAVSLELARKMLGVEEAYLSAALDEIEARCGSIESYLEAGGVDSATCETLRARLTQPGTAGTTRIKR